MKKLSAPGRSGATLETPAAGPTAAEIVCTVVDPELPMVSVTDLGMVREVTERDGRVEVVITPTYSGCPAIVEISHDLRHRLHRAGYSDVVITRRISPPWTSDWITPRGRAALADAGIAPPGPAAGRRQGPVPLALSRPTPVPCPRCGSTRTERTATFGAAACRSLHKCLDCAEPFDAVKEI